MLGFSVVVGSSVELVGVSVTAIVDVSEAVAASVGVGAIEEPTAGITSEDNVDSTGEAVLLGKTALTTVVEPLAAMEEDERWGS